MEQRGLWRVIAVNPENEAIVIDAQVVANDEANARVKALKGVAADYDLDDLDFIVVRLGNVRAKRRPQEIRIIKQGMVTGDVAGAVAIELQRRSHLG